MSAWVPAKTNTPKDGKKIKIRGDMFELTAIVRAGHVYHFDTGLPIILRIVDWRYA